MLLPDWEASKGARIEKQLAEYCGVKIVEFGGFGSIAEPILFREVCDARA